MNQLYLIKENRKTTDFVKLEAEGKLLYISKGKVCKTGVAKITRGCGSDEKALAELEQTAEQYLGKGYRIGKESPKDVRETVSYDKAKWHLGGDFPDGLDDYQAYVHTGLYINWIIDNDLSSDLSLQEYPAEIRRVKEKLITGTRFYFEYLDGIFSTDELNETGADFTSDYFDFEKGQYLSDLEATLAEDLPSLYHIMDTRENYDLIRKRIDQRFKEWLRKRKNNTTQHCT
ncbi:MAG: hypothetical protein ACO1OQ_07225 [Rufibacter sp.]